jgi:hypothetical protein
MPIFSVFRTPAERVQGGASHDCHVCDQKAGMMCREMVVDGGRKDSISIVNEEHEK